MTKFACLLLAAAILFSACTNETYYRTKTGLLYRVISSPGKDSIARMGNTVKLRYVQKVGDTVIDNIYDKMPLYYMILPGMSPYNPLETFDYGLKEGDSVETIQRIDSMMKKGIFKKMSPWMKKDDQWITTFKVEKVFLSDSLLQADKEQETKKVTGWQKKKGAERIETFLDRHQIKTTTRTNDLYEVVLNPGNGPKAEAGKYVSMDFTVKTLKGKTLNSTTDTGFHQKGPVGMVIGMGGMPPMVEERLKYLQKGARVQMYIPGVLIFGVTPQSKDVKADDDIIFDLQLVDVQDKAPVPPQVAPATSKPAH